MPVDGRFGEFGGTYVPETLVPALAELQQAFDDAQNDATFAAELHDLLCNYAGRPTPLYRAANLSRDWGANIFFKREDLLHGGAHKTNNALGQAVLAKRMGKQRIIAETGAGQHGVAVAMACALLGLQAEIYMGEVDMQRQKPNVDRMRLLGATVHPVTSGGRTLKDAINEALRDWITNLRTTHYLLGTAAGPHPFPTMVKFFQRVIGDEARAQYQEKPGALPDYVVACVGGGSNAIGIFAGFENDDQVRLVGVEPAGKGLHTQEHGAVLALGTPGCLHGMKSLVLQTADGQILETHSLSAGLDYPSVGPEHAFLRDSGRAQYFSATDEEAVCAFEELARQEGIIPALESAHAIAYAKKLAATAPGANILISLSGRGDKDLDHVAAYRNGCASGANQAAVQPATAPQVGGANADSGQGSSAKPASATTQSAAASDQGERYKHLQLRMQKEHRKAYIPFTVLGWPNAEQSLAIIEKMIAAGADALELGVAFSEPVADGPEIQRAVNETLESGFTVDGALQIVADVRLRHRQIPIGLLVYYNVVLKRGISQFYADAQQAGVDSILIADLPVEAAHEVAASAAQFNIAQIFIASSLSNDVRLERIAKHASGYIYVVSRLGITGVEERYDADLQRLLSRLRQHTDLPLFVGFGVSSPEQARQMATLGADGVITGSRIIQLARLGMDKIEPYVRSMRDALTGAAAGS